jgi:hypothetical protein
MFHFSSRLRGRNQPSRDFAPDMCLFCVTAPERIDPDRALDNGDRRSKSNQVSRKLIGFASFVQRPKPEQLPAPVFHVKTAPALRRVNSDCDHFAE